MTGHTTHHAFVDSPIGTLTLIADGDAIVEVWFPNHADGPTASLDESTLDPDHPVLARTSVQLAEYFAGTRTEFDLPLAPEGTPFQLAAWRGAVDDPVRRDGELRRAGLAPRRRRTRLGRSVPPTAATPSRSSSRATG